MKTAIVIGLSVLVVASAFGISIGIGGGANILGIVGIPLLADYPFYTLSGNIVLPLSGQIALTGNFEYLSLPSVLTAVGYSSNIFLATGGVRYIYGLPTGAVKTFVGLDGGMLLGTLSYSSQQITIGNNFVVGPNIGMTIQLTKMLSVYLEGAARIILGSSGSGISFDDINAGLNLSF